MTKMTKEQQIEVCNAINTAIANGYTVMVNKTIPIAGAILDAGRLSLAIRHQAPHTHCRLLLDVGDRMPIVATRGDEVIVIYEPPPKEKVLPESLAPNFFDAGQPTQEPSVEQTLQAIQKDIATIAQTLVEANKRFANKCPTSADWQAKRELIHNAPSRDSAASNPDLSNPNP